MLLPPITEFWAARDYDVIPARHQNFYPDLSLISPEGGKLALDLKTCYRLFTTSGEFRGSGNTRNIGSVRDIEALQQGKGPFTHLGAIGKQVFDEYWQQYLNRDMARAAELAKPPFRNLKEYLRYRNRTDLLELLE